MSTIFSTHVTLKIKEINHPAFLQEWKLNIDTEEYEKNMRFNIYKPSEKKKIYRVDNHKNWTASIKETIQWFPFLTIMEHTANKTQDDKGLISSLLKMSSMLEIHSVQIFLSINQAYF